MKSILVFDIVYDNNFETLVTYIANKKDSQRGCLTYSYSEEEEKLLNKLNTISMRYLMDSVYELPNNISKEDIINKLQLLGFEYKPNFAKNI